jgi:SAM-dependent methyltransferase
MAELNNAFSVYLFAMSCGLRAIMAGSIRNGLKLLISPIGYWRFLPNAFVLQEFNSLDNPKVLDASSPKLLSLMLASRTENKVYATDLNDEQIFSRWQQLARTLGLKNYEVEYQDARKLKYPDDFFDLVYSISVIEHIPGEGDIEALREFCRVLKTEGRLVIEVPYRRQREEITAPYDSKGAPVETPQFYERHYDAGSLRERLEDVQRLNLERKVILGETMPIDPWIASRWLPRPLRIALLPLEPLLAAFNYWSRCHDRVGRPLAALLVYRKV